MSETQGAASGQAGASTGPGGGWWARVWRELWTPLLLFVLAFGVFTGFAWDRVGKPSTDPHFVYLANAMLDGTLELQRSPPHGNDWASFEWMRLRSGQELEGVWLDRRTRRFQTLDGQVYVVDASEVDPGQHRTRYFVSFPPAPAVLMIPLAAISGYDVDDVTFTIFFAALNVALCFVVLQVLSRDGPSGRSRADNLWLTVLFGFGTVHLWCAVLGQVWFTALVVGATFTLLYILAAREARHPVWAGLFLAAGFATRTPILFGAVYFVGWVMFPEGRLRRGGWGEAARKLALFAVPCLVVGALLLWANEARFGSWTEFGHTYLAAGQIDRIRRFGLFNIHFLSKNLSAALTLLPRFQPEAPYVLVSRHGMSLLMTTPVLGYLLWPRVRETASERLYHGVTWAAVVAMALPGLLYQNTGYEQFGYRFSLDYTAFLVMLLALGQRRLSWWFKALVIAGIVVNAFGAITFKRYEVFYLPGAQFFE